MKVSAVWWSGHLPSTISFSVEALPRLAECARDLVGVGLRRHAGGARDLGDPLPVLVGAGEEVDAIPAQAAVPAHGIGGDGGVRVPEVRARVDVVDRRGQVEGAVGHLVLTSR